jgi:hypothetical protein
MIVREHIRLGSPVTGTADLVQAVMQQEPYKKIILYFADENGAEMAVCAAPVRWTYRQVIQRLLSYAPVIPPEKDPFAQ